jgi:urea transport system permease protein
MGCLLVLTVLIAPNGLVLGLMNWLGRLAISQKRGMR